MNEVILMGRLARDPNVTKNNDMSIARYTLAVDRRYKKDGEATADFISCVTFGKNAEFAEKYLKKGTKIAVTGRIQTGSFQKDGQTIYTTDVVVDTHEFAESKSGTGTSSNESTAPAQSNDGFMNINDFNDDLPFD